MTKLHIVSILDRSGSMGGTETEVIGAYNAFIKEQAKIASDNSIKATATLVLFDDKYEEVYIKTPIEEAPELTNKVYFIRGMTALFDAVGKTIKSLEGKKKVIFFIETDGGENASKEYTKSSLQALVKQKTEDGWDFNFVGADLDAATVQTMGGVMGIAAGKTMAFGKSAEGYRDRNMSFSASTIAYVVGDTEASVVGDTDVST